MSDLRKATEAVLGMGYEDAEDVAGDFTSEEIESEIWAMARSYCSEHPVDDEEPITLGWLRSVGFVRHMQSAASNDLSITCDKSSLCLHEKWVWSCYSAIQLPSYIPAALAPKNRGQVRRLCSALGIELQEKK